MLPLLAAVGVSLRQVRRGQGAVLARSAAWGEQGEGELDPRRPGVSATLLFAAPPWPADMHVYPLLGERIGPVFSPGFAHAPALQGKPPASLAGEPLLHTLSRPQAWTDWARASGVDEGSLHAGQGFEHLYYLIEAALAGLGVAIAPQLLVADDIASGRLLAPWGFVETANQLALWVPGRDKMELRMEVDQRSGAVTGANLGSAGAVATAGVAGSPYAITISGATGTGLDNYAITYQSGQFTVTPRAITVTANGGNSTYGDNPANPGLSATNLAAFDDVSDLTGLVNSFGIDGTTNAGTYTLTVTGTLTNANYQVTATSPGTWVVGRKALTVTADNQIKTYGDLFVFAGTEFSTEGLINGDQVLRALLASDGAINTASAAGSPYVITIGGATGTGLDNYTITYVPGRMVVTPGPTSFVRTSLLETADMADPFSYHHDQSAEDDDLDSPPKGEIEFVPRDFPGTITTLSSGEVE